eukprot:CAMPEP_0176302188 /NCGR_PEP_ID=MMETSP0121_2-20121125/61253_1 /TAXON_ID=160619 /ORGANISM="Kryptoperidinium foliaceum, Strain CCMP 1326" /LENGTH=35 /DNA_ID= /DNA_START= /DNA_END= /DNA_ORIENTATION=
MNQELLQPIVAELTGGESVPALNTELAHLPHDRAN